MNIFGTSDAKVVLPDPTANSTDEAHGEIAAKMDELERRMIQQSFALRDVEMVVADAGRHGKLQEMQMNMVGVAVMTRASREALDASLMLIDRIRKGLQANKELREKNADLAEMNVRLSKIAFPGGQN